MAKKPATLSFRDIVLGAEADVIRAALDARVKIDVLITERQAAYARIADLETQVATLVGEPGVYPFPAPPLPVASFDVKSTAKKSAAGGATTETDDVDESEDDESSAKA